MSKRYGLILPETFKKAPIFEATKNVFGDDDSDEETKDKKSFIPTDSSNTKRQAKITQAKALEEDASVYQYDEVYDEIKEKVNEVKEKVKAEKNPKYIENLLKTAQKRKLENERRLERQVHKEREKEGNEFADKEVFVTSAYKKKLEEMRKEDEKEKYEEYLEQIGDVTKQKDLGGFYRHLYEQKLGAAETNSEITEKKSPQDNKLKCDESTNKTKDDKPRNRNYRKRKLSTEQDPNMSDGEIVSDEEINRLNLQIIKAAKVNHKDINIDADSDFSVNDPSDDEEENETPTKDSPKFTKDTTEKKFNKENIKNEIKQEVSEIKQEHKKFDVESNLDNKTIEAPRKPKIDIWKKRTVGAVFDEALKRYYERKAAKSG